ncbi:MAG TPA: copper-binding protein [Vicinamibacterales bacterium]|jgi:Cu/Ag efflux protein CusF|nr:copper-binding protein [Vicinamibacterales bacterium]
MNMHRRRPGLVAITAFIAGLALACTSGDSRRQNDQASQQVQKVAHQFKGKVEAVDAAGKKLTVNGENVEGWMGAMTMMYTPDKDDVLTKVKPGDEITATVFDGDFQTLYDVQVTSTQ